MDINPPMLNKIKEASASQAKHFLEKFGEFYPFAVAINFEDEIIPIGVYFGEEHPSVKKVLLNIEIAIKKGKDEGRYKIVAICSNVFVAPPGNHIKLDALELRIDGLELQRINLYLPYTKQDENIEFTESYLEEGNLVIW